MDRLDIINYYIKVLKSYRKLQRNILKKEFGTKQNWEKELDETKYNDKNLKSFVNHIIDLGILKENGTNERGDTIYQPDETGARLSQEKAEEHITILENYGYSIERNDYSLLFKL